MDKEVNKQYCLHMKYQCFVVVVATTRPLKIYINRNLEVNTPKRSMDDTDPEENFEHNLARSQYITLKCKF